MICGCGYLKLIVLGCQTARQMRGLVFDSEVLTSGWLAACWLAACWLTGWLVGWLSIVGCLIVLDWFAEHLGRHVGRQDGCLLVVSLLWFGSLSALSDVFFYFSRACLPRSRQPLIPLDSHRLTSSLSLQFCPHFNPPSPSRCTYVAFVLHFT
jgi:hypothetical protein